MARARAPELVGRIGVNLAGPTLLAHGSSEQKERWLSKILSAEELWCQLFSEPGAGSDLASVSTRADAVEGGWVLNGQKVWTSYAQFADWGVCLARTDADAPKPARPEASAAPGEQQATPDHARHSADAGHKTRKNHSRAHHRTAKQHPLQCLDDGYLGAEAVPDRAQFQANVAAADDDEVSRHLVERQRFRRADDAAAIEGQGG